MPNVRVLELVAFIRELGPEHVILMNRISVLLKEPQTIFYLFFSLSKDIMRN
jgi:hypothetical protein